MGIRIFLCSSTYPEKEITKRRLGIDVTTSIAGFVKGISRMDVPPFLQSYQMMLYSYFYVNKLLSRYKPSFLIMTGESCLIPKKIATRSIVYVHFPVGLFTEHGLNSTMKKLQISSWQIISNINKATLITNSSYEKRLIRLAWKKDATVIYPPCPQYSFPLNKFKENAVCTLSRFTPEKGYETILEVARRTPDAQFYLVGSVSPDMVHYSKKLMRDAPNNVVFNINANIEQKVNILKKSKVLLHGFIGEQFGIAIVEAMSSGIIPVTHDSGAPKEDALVPPRFRYNDVDQAVKSVQDALSFWSPEQAEKLREAAKKFSPESFKTKMKSFILNWIKSRDLENNV